MPYGKIQKISAFLGEGAPFTIDPSETLSDGGRGGSQSVAVSSFYVSGSCEHFTRITSLKVYTIP